MNFSIQRLYKRSVAILCLALLWLMLVQVLVFSLYHLRNDVHREIGTQAAMIAEEIKNGADPAQALELATRNPQLALACILNSEGETQHFLRGMTYDAMLRDPHNPQTLDVQCRRYAGASSLGLLLVQVRAAIPDAELPRAVGDVVLIGSTPSIFEHLGKHIVAFLGTIVLFLLLCIWLGVILRKTILRPIRQIATTAQRVTLYKDYSLRVSPGALTTLPQEIELLIDSFNAMLKEIEDRDGRLMRKTVELEKSREHAEAANVAKSQFLANISHELRTPLNAIIGFSTMVREQQFGPIGDPKYVEYARDIHDSGKHLLDIINDILDLSHAESGKLSVRFEQLTLTKLIDKALNIVAGQAHERKIDIYTDVPEKLPKIVADRVRLVQILLNVLSNAIKFTEPGGHIILRVGVEPSKDSVYYFTIVIEDTGIGMSAEEIRNAFTNFNQADSGLNRRYEGAGLGLPLTKKLVELHHGRITIESEKGKGTRVTIRLMSDPALLD